MSPSHVTQGEICVDWWMSAREIPKTIHVFSGLPKDVGGSSGCLEFNHAQEKPDEIFLGVGGETCYGRLAFIWRIKYIQDLPGAARRLLDSETP